MLRGPRDHPRRPERRRRRGVAGLGDNQRRGSRARRGDCCVSSRRRGCLHRNRLPRSQWLRFRRDDRRRLAGRTDATERRSANYDQRDEGRRAGVSGVELACVPRPSRPCIPVATCRRKNFAGRSSVVGLFCEISARRIWARAPDAPLHLRRRACCVISALLLCEVAMMSPVPGLAVTRGFEWRIRGSTSRSPSV